MAMTNDENAIFNLLHRYCELQDAADFAGVAELFRDATYRVHQGPTCQGYDEVYRLKSHHARTHADGTLRTKHVTTNTIVVLGDDGTNATTRSYFVVLQATTALTLQPVIAGRYLDAFVRVGGAWRFADRLIHADLVGDLTEHIRDNPLEGQ